MRPIDADVLVKKFEALEWETLLNTYGAAILETNNMPTLDVEPVIHAHWITTHYEMGGVIKRSIYVTCSECKGTSVDATPFCPNCGAQMDESEVK